MSNRLPVEVNPFRLIEQCRQLSGVIPLRHLPRVSDLALVSETVDDSTGGFAVALDFLRSPSKLPMITGSVRGQVELECQRCLEAISVAVDTRINVVVTTSQTDRRPEEEGYEICIVTDERLFLQDFIEDEILLALPVVPRHDQCEPVRVVQEIPESISEITVTDDEQDTQKGKSNPFAVLKDWNKTE